MNIAATGRVAVEDNVARSKYIYIVRKATLKREFLGAFTVKHEAILWALRNGWPPEHANLFRTRDGLHADKTEYLIPWAEERAI